MPRETAAEHRSRIRMQRREEPRVSRSQQRPTRRVRSADVLSPLRHRENVLLQPRRRSADGCSTAMPGAAIITMTVPSADLIDPDDPGRLISSAGSSRAAFPGGTRPISAKLMQLLDAREQEQEQEELLRKKTREWDFVSRGSSAPAVAGRPSTPLSWDSVEIGANRSRRRHSAQVQAQAHGDRKAKLRPKSAIEVVESALDGTFRVSPKRIRARGATDAASISTVAPPEREVQKRVHNLYHSSKDWDSYNEDDADDDKEAKYEGKWITHKYLPTKRGNQRREGIVDGTGGMQGMSMQEMMMAAVTAQQEEEYQEYREQALTQHTYAS